MAQLRLSKQAKTRLLSSLWRVHRRTSRFMPNKIKSNFESALKEPINYDRFYQNKKEFLKKREHDKLKLVTKRINPLVISKSDRNLAGIKSIRKLLNLGIFNNKENIKFPLRRSRRFFWTKWKYKRKIFKRRRRKALLKQGSILSKSKKNSRFKIAKAKKIVKKKSKLKIRRFYKRRRRIKKYLRRRKKFRKILFSKFRKLRRLKIYLKNRSRIASKVNRYTYGYKINVSVRANNVFCNLATFPNNKVKQTCTAGKYKTKVSKKMIRFVYNDIVTKFFRRIKKYFFRKQKKDLKAFKAEKKRKKKALRYLFIPKRKSGLIVTIVASTRKRRKLIKNVGYHFKGLPIVIRILDKKIFNGCRAPKKMRKKRKRMRVLK